MLAMQGATCPQPPKGAESGVIQQHLCQGQAGRDAALEDEPKLPTPGHGSNLPENHLAYLAMAEVDGIATSCLCSSGQTTDLVKSGR